MTRGARFTRRVESTGRVGIALSVVMGCLTVCTFGAPAGASPPEHITNGSVWVVSAKDRSGCDGEYTFSTTSDHHDGYDGFFTWDHGGGQQGGPWKGGRSWLILFYNAPSEPEATFRLTYRPATGIFQGYTTSTQTPKRYSIILTEGSQPGC